MRHMGNYPTLFTVEYWSDIENQLVSVNGLIYADSIVHAAEIIDDYYGSNVEKVEFQMLEQGIIELDDEKFKEIRNYLEEQIV